jgi:hypothetical protein
VLCERKLYFGAPGWRQRTVLDVAVVDPTSPEPRSNCFAGDLITVDAAFKTSTGGYLRPDILDLHTRELFEIKPESRRIEGLEQLYESITLFNGLVASYQALPPSPEADLLRTVRPIEPGLWVPPRVVDVGLGDAVYAWLEEPGLILYRQGRRKSNRQRVSIAALRSLEDEEQDLVGRLKSELRYLEVAKYTAITVIIIAVLLSTVGTAAPAAGAVEGALGEGVAAGAAAEGAAGWAAVGAEGAAAGGAAAGAEGAAAVGAEGAAAGDAAVARQVASVTETVTETATRFRPPQWDYGPRTGTSAADLAKLGAMVDPGLVGGTDKPVMATEGAPLSEPVADEGAYVEQLAWELLLRLPCGTAAAEARGQIVRGGGAVDFSHTALASSGSR